MSLIAQATAFFGALATLITLITSATIAVKNRSLSHLENLRTAQSPNDDSEDSPLRRAERFQHAQIAAYEDLRPLIESRRRDALVFGALAYFFAALTAFVATVTVMSPHQSPADWLFLACASAMAVGLCLASMLTFTSWTIIDDERQRRFSECFLHPKHSSPFGFQPPRLSDLGREQPRILFTGLYMALLTSLAGSSIGIVGVGLIEPTALPELLIASAGALLATCPLLLFILTRQKPRSTESIWQKDLKPTSAPTDDGSAAEDDR